jgi:hypothetical protein
MRRYVFGLAMLTLALLAPTVVRGNDQEIAQQIGQRLEAEKKAGSLKGFKIDVQVDDGTVWMSGSVSTSQQQTTVLDIARRVEGVKQVVNDLTVTVPATPKPTTMLTSLRRAGGEDEEGQVRPAGAIGTGVTAAASNPVVQSARPVVQPASSQPTRSQPAAAPYAAAYAPVPVYAGSQNQVPLAFAPARPVSHQGEVIGGVPGTPVPMHMPGSGVGIAPARYDHPSMPGYAWPSYAAYPNYAAVTYPKQYSPSAWPYIGPFYPYPQVPLGWRKVTLEWDDGWWMLDFKQRRSMYNHH